VATRPASLVGPDDADLRAQVRVVSPSPGSLPERLEYPPAGSILQAQLSQPNLDHAAIPRESGQSIGGECLGSGLGSVS